MDHIYSQVTDSHIEITISYDGSKPRLLPVIDGEVKELAEPDIAGPEQGHAQAE